ncbi:light harvesting complex protein I-20 [Coccomyxa subellipsoidea C-169]|uniref:Chlorophyll a-b binding protein, chloroplastic n=1 Tax=Coccomyxa subellipsoidea (strain C-169) TaxID=574566 RepID=I0YQ45_COCSC|nr:light harvesting complex protein I-20 [Coccomyxa subellipsoidea C-169]EIE20514.1 light harvesting complex protein I-20 [Coccomyxa subellipsoidea C-169]|eukprot:XP_005645058.1 light harvesting complex protein I-20 [Coccomyxa subellipsoidea C-169]
MAAAMLTSSFVARGAARPATKLPKSNGSRVVMKAGNWLPGSDTPAYLDGLPGSFGFDPFGLGSTPANLQRFQEAELVHSRWAMAGVAGALGAELLGQGDWYQAPLWAVNGGAPTYLGIPVPFNLSTLLAIEFVAIAGAEAQRNAEPDAEKRKYPGGAFDPLGFSKDSKVLEENKLKELKNGRLAMLAFVGFIAQHAATGKGPLEALKLHLADPWGANFATNGVSIPYLT